MKERQFKVGDRVQIASSSRYAKQCSEVGTIKETQDGALCFIVKFDNDYINSYGPQDLVHDPDMTPLFYVGDKIQITQGSGHWVDDMDQYVGQKATITKVEKGYMIDRLYRIDIDKGQWKWIAEAGHFIHAPQAGIDQKDELLHRAKQMFPVGTKFSPAHVLYDEKYPKYLIMTEDSKIEFSGSYIFACIKNGNVCDMSGDLKYGNTTYNRVLYDATEKKWATVLGKAEDDEPIPATALLLIEAKKRYPIGTKYKNATDGREVFTVTEQSFSVVSEHTIHGEPGAGCLMYGGKWAEIVKGESHKFKIGDWVIGNSKANERYAVTKEGWSGQVTKVRDDGHISVKGKYNEDNDEYHDLDPDRFDLTTESELMRLTGHVEAPIIHKYKVGDILHLTEYCHGVTPQKVTVQALSTRHGKPAYCLQRWSGEFPEDILIQREVVKPTDKFKKGDWVIGTCTPHSPYAITCKGWIGRVVGLNPDGTMDVNTDASISIYRNVQPEYFEHHKTESVFSTDYLQQQMDKVSASIGLSHEKLRVYSSGSIGSSIPVVQPQVSVKKVSFNRI